MDQQSNLHYKNDCALSTDATVMEKFKKSVSDRSLREGCRLRVFDNWILRLKFVSKKDANGEWRRLYNEKLCSLFRSPNIVRMIKSRKLRWTGHIAKMEECRSTFKILTGTPTGKKP